MIQYEGKTYLTVTDVARQFGISRPTCYTNLLPHMHKCYLPGRKNALYNQSEVEQFAGIRTEENRSASPTLSALTEEAGDGVTANHEIVKVDRQSQYSPACSQMQKVSAERVMP